MNLPASITGLNGNMGSRGPINSDDKPYKGKFWIAVYQPDTKRGERLFDIFETRGEFTKWLTGSKEVTYEGRCTSIVVLAQAWRYLTGRPFPWKRNGFIKDGIHYTIYYIAIDDNDFNIYLDKDFERIYSALYPDGSQKQHLQEKKRRKTEK